MLNRYGRLSRFILAGFLFVPTLYAAGLKLKWQANVESDLAGYKVHVGSSSKNYDRSLDVGNVTETVVQDLQVSRGYYLSVTAYDKTGNESLYSQEINITLGDVQAPTLVSITPLSRTELLLVFSEPVEEKSSQTVANYRIEPAVTISSVKLQSDAKTVLVTTAEHQPGSSYILTVNNISDRALPVNTIKADSKLTFQMGSGDSDTTPPVLNMATLTSATELTLLFSEPLDAASAKILTNYTVSNGVQIHSVSLSGDASQVRLTTSEHQAGVSYSVTVKNITDQSSRKNVIPENSSYTYAYDPGDITGPVMTLVNAVEQNTIEIMFNEPVERSSSETAANYSISAGITVTSASLDASGQVVRLQTSPHVANQLYVLTVNNVCDQSDHKNKLVANSVFSYVYTPADQIGPTIAKVTVKDFTHILVLFSETLDQASAEDPAHYVISNNVRVYNVKMAADGKSVDLETTPHVSGQLYLLQVSQVTDASSQANLIQANSSYAYVYGAAEAEAGPTIVEVKPLTATGLQVTFNKPVQKSGAQTAANYAINRNTLVSAAELDASATRVTLQTSVHESGKIYIISISNIVAAAGNNAMILPNSSYSYIYEAADQVGPVVALVKVVDAEHLDVLFNERVASDEGNRSTNYAINGGIEVKAAELDAGKRIARLTTSRHISQTLYVLRINNVKDEAAGNVIAANSSYSYVYEPSDALAPTIAAVQVKDAQHLEMVFSENVDMSTALKAGNYSLNNGAEIKAVQAAGSDHMVRLETSVLQLGKIYVAVVNQVQDLAGNQIMANSAYTFTFGDLTDEQTPAMTSVYTYTATELYVVFNMKVNKTQAEKTTNYVIQGGPTVSSAVLDGSMTQVTLRTAAHESGRIYALVAGNISRWDRPDLLIKANVPYFYTLQQSATAAPKLEKVEIEGENLLRVTFSQSVEKLSAENKSNYHINEKLAVLSAEWQSEANQVLLETARHQSGKAYTLSVGGVKSSNGSALMTAATMAYTYMPTLEIKVDGVAEAMISYVDVGRPYYVDRNYVITSAPDDLIRAKLIMTANNDRTLTDSRFMVIQLSKAALVYVAYDDDSQAVPNWLDANFVKSSDFLGVSESSNRLRLWSGYFPAGRLVLGANAAVGSRGSQMMYVVLIQEGDFSDPAGGGYTEGGATTRKIPESVNLLSNYPNPFNPRTTIRFDLPYDKEVQIVVFDILGRLVRTLYHSNATAGQHTVIWDGTNEDHIPVAAGVYFYRMNAWENGTRNGLAYKENFECFTRKMTLLK